MKSVARNDTRRLGQNARREAKRERGIVLAIVLVLIFALITAVYAFQRRAIIDTAVAKNRLYGAEADALARGGLRIGEAIVFLTRLKGTADGTGSTEAAASGLAGISAEEIWANVGEFPLELEDGKRLRISIEDEGARLNLNALVQPGEEDDDSGFDDESEEYLVAVLDYIVDGIDALPEEKNYDTRAIAQNLLDYIDADEDARSGRNEDAYYRSQDPPYRPRNGPFLSVDEIGLVEGVDPQLLSAMRDYVTVHPIGSVGGINLNRAQPWVLSIVYSGSSGDRELVREATVRDIWKLRKESKILCNDASADPVRCVTPSEVGNGALADGSIYPEANLPARPTVFRVVAEAEVGNLTRSLEAIYDTRPAERPQLLSWRRLRGPDS